MTCHEAEQSIEAFLNRELSSKQFEDFLIHVKSCKECYEELEIYYTLLIALPKFEEEPGVAYDLEYLLEQYLEESERQLGKNRFIATCYSLYFFLAEMILFLFFITKLFEYLM